MKSESEGINRLSMLLGIVCVCIWLVIVIFVTDCFQSRTVPSAWLLVIVGVPMSYILPYGMVRGIAWVVDGFKKDRGGA
ncbi:hypothetical protein DOJK_02017 [Patescibacteria group bacterium]|nr:hypothetical protein DOJK_02017 [Patescibacteria group bacterium]